jgi:hypothetical protein
MKILKLAHITLLFIFCLTAYCNANPKDLLSDNAVQQQAKLMGEAFLKNDYETFARYTYPAIVKAMGGSKRMISALSQTVNDMRAKGMFFSGISVDSPSNIVRSGKELQCTLQQHTVIKLANGRAVVTSTLIAISQDGGKDWWFIDTSNKDVAAMKKSLPNLSADIIIPPQRKPVFYNF